MKDSLRIDQGTMYTEPRQIPEPRQEQKSNHPKSITSSSYSSRSGYIAATNASKFGSSLNDLRLAQ